MLRGKHCKPGDKVRLLHEKGEGIVVRNTPQFVYVDLGDGFELPVLHNDVIIVQQMGQDAALNIDLEMANKKEDEPQQNITTVSDVPKKSVSHKSPTLNKGIYFAFVPLNQQIPIAGDLMVYLVNFTNLSGYFALFLQDKQSFILRHKGEIEAASAVLLETIERKDIAYFRKGLFQCIFTDVHSNGIPLPMIAQIELKPERFSKEELYDYNKAVQARALSLQLFRIDEIRCFQAVLPINDDFVINSVQSKIIENQSLISRFQTAPGEAEVDLHIEKLVDNYETFDDGLKLKKQLDVFRQCLQSAIDENFRKVVFIHGVGVGVLKMEIHKILREYDFIEFRDAPIAKYGIGATEIFIRQKKV